MNHRQRFNAIWNYEPVDRMPVYYFGTWQETRARWLSEDAAAFGDAPDQADLPEMDPDWERGMWTAHGIVECGALGDIEPKVLEETDGYIIRRDHVGNVRKEAKGGSSIPHYLEHGLKPTRDSWDRFKRFLDPDMPRRWTSNWEPIAESVRQRDRVAAIIGGSLYAGPRDWLGVEALSYLMYDDPILFEEMVEHTAEHFMAIYKPIIETLDLDFVYFFEDCCFNTGPLFSPQIYRDVFDKYYRRLLRFYKDAGIRWALIDSDGNVEQLVPLWLESGFDIIFPIEVGTWRACVNAYRKRYGRRLRMFGGLNKHVIPQGDAAIRQHLLKVKPTVDEGGYIPIPDHRIPPDYSLAQFRQYLQVFNEIFNPR